MTIDNMNVNMSTWGPESEPEAVTKIRTVSPEVAHLAARATETREIGMTKNLVSTSVFDSLSSPFQVVTVVIF